jgi:hypothetical protein
MLLMEALGTVSIDFLQGLQPLANAGSPGREIDQAGLNFIEVSSSEISSQRDALFRRSGPLPSKPQRNRSAILSCRQAANC